MTSITRGPAGILLTGFGTIFRTGGIDPTFADWSFTASRTGVEFRFESTSSAFEQLVPAAIPEPGSMILFGTGLLGLANAARRRLRRK